MKPKTNENIPSKPKKCIGVLPNLFKKVIEMRSSNPFENRFQPPYFVVPCILIL